jgi:hypothetical protein
MLQSVVIQSPNDEKLLNFRPYYCRIELFWRAAYGSLRAESAVRAMAEKYFALYTAEDLDGVMSLWS